MFSQTLHNDNCNGTIEGEKTCFVKTRSSSITKQRKMLEISPQNKVHLYQIKHIKLRVTLLSVSASIRHVGPILREKGRCGKNNKSCSYKEANTSFAVFLKIHLFSGFARAISFVRLNCFERKSAARWSVHAFGNCVPFAGTVESVVGVLNVSMLLMDICVLVLVLVVGVALFLFSKPVSA